MFTVVLFTVAKTLQQPMSTDRWMEKEDGVCVCVCVSSQAQMEESMENQ